MKLGTNGALIATETIQRALLSSLFGCLKIIGNNCSPNTEIYTIQLPSSHEFFNVFASIIATKRQIYECIVNTLERAGRVIRHQFLFMLRPVERADPFFCNPTAISGREGAYILNRKHSRPRLLDHPCRETTKKLEGGKVRSNDSRIFFKTFPFNYFRASRVFHAWHD